MALNDIPVLSADHPLYDWSDHQSSRDALVSGTPTQYFAKEAWNAIVDSLSDALTAAGLEWDDTYTTAEGAKITAAYGPLSAQAFNSVRHNIESPAPLGWQWAFNPDFRGYVGREDFRGRATHKNKSDEVYPEYIIELARKLNLLIEIMRGTALLAEVEAKQLSTVKVLADVLPQPSVPLGASYNAATSVSKAPVDVQRAAHVVVDHNSKTLVSADVIPDKAVPLGATYYAPVRMQAAARVRQAMQVAPGKVLVGVKGKATVDAVKVIDTGASALVASLSKGSADSVPSLPMPPASAIVASRGKADAGKARSLPTGVKASTASLGQANVDSGRPLSVSASHLAGVKASRVALGTAWLPPVWVNGGLWIRQVHDAPVQREDGSLEVI